EATLEAPAMPSSPSQPQWVHQPQPAVRLGLGQIKGLSRQAGKRIEQARHASPFVSTQDLAARAGLDRREMNMLAAADALKPLSGERRQAQWQSALQMSQGLLRGSPIQETQIPLLPP